MYCFSPTFRLHAIARTLFQLFVHACVIIIRAGVSMLSVTWDHVPEYLMMLGFSYPLHQHNMQRRTTLRIYGSVVCFHPSDSYSYSNQLPTHVTEPLGSLQITCTSVPTTVDKLHFTNHCMNHRVVTTYDPGNHYCL